MNRPTITTDYVNLPHHAPQAGCGHHLHFQAAAGVHLPAIVHGGTTAAAVGCRESRPLPGRWPGRGSGEGIR